MNSNGTDLPAWSPADPGEKTPTAHETGYDGGTDYAGPVAPGEPGAIEEDVIVIATQESACYGDPPGPGSGAQQWSEIKAMFVDDPSGSVRAASGLVEKAIEGLMTSVMQRQDSLATSWQAGDAAGTEELRNALRRYRGLCDELDQMSRQFPAGHDRVAGFYLSLAKLPN